MPFERWILHADMDAFYASIEQRDHPELRGRPVIVGATSPRGVVAAASYEARRYGVRSAMPRFRAHQLCPDGVYLPSNIRHYAAVSRQIQTLFHEFTPLVEPLALDEAFLDVSGSVQLFGSDVGTLARELKRRVFAETELRVSVGLAPSKLVAKIACNLDKPDGLRIARAHEVRELLGPLPVSFLWGVGPVLEQRLLAVGIDTLAGLADAELSVLESLVGRRARELQARARGQDERPVESERAPKSIGEENTFEVDVCSAARVLEVVAAHADTVAKRLRRGGYRGRTVTLKIKLAHADAERASGRGPHYPILTRSKTLSTGTDDARQIGAVASQLWRSEALEKPIRLLGVSVSSLQAVSSAQPEQLSLFEGKTARGPLGPMLDAITERFGAHAIRRAIDAPTKVTHGRGIKRGEH
jgi:DNA polymerase-4